MKGQKCVECGSDSESNYVIQKVYDSVIEDLFIVKCADCGVFNTFKLKRPYEVFAITVGASLSWGWLNTRDIFFDTLEEVEQEWQ